MEALCSPRSSESPQNIKTCLNALYTLLDSTWARKVFISDRSLPIELCNVLHRLLLTRESYVIQMIVMEVLKQVMKAAQEDLAERKRLKLKGTLTLKLFSVILTIFYIAYTYIKKMYTFL